MKPLQNGVFFLNVKIVVMKIECGFENEYNKYVFKCDLEQASATIVSAALAVEYLARYAAHLIIVVPGKFRSGTNVL